MRELVYWIWLSLSITPGSEAFLKLMNKYGSPEKIYFLSEAELLSVISSDCRDFKSLSDKNLKKAEEILDFCTRKNVGILTYGDEKYPTSLKSIENPPVLLYYRGVLPMFDEKCFISIVGTRTLSAYGKTNTFKIAYDLAASGAIIVSGMAKGIDGVALAGALAAGESTVAVIGSGIDVCYPSEHKRLAREIVKNGCVFTEFAPGTKPERYNFPKRNRIISALTSATVVMEGRESSGAMITARYAEKYGRRIYAFPGNVGNPNSQASNLLIKNGAKLFTTADDIIRDFDKTIPARLNPFKLPEHVEYDMNEVLSELEVSAITSAEDIGRARKGKTKKQKTTDAVNENPQPMNNKAPEEALLVFDKPALSLYKKIPLNGECPIESLIDSEHSFPEVMKGLINLEIAKLVIMLPGDRVKRNLK